MVFLPGSACRCSVLLAPHGPSTRPIGMSRYSQIIQGLEQQVRHWQDTIKALETSSLKLRTRIAAAHLLIQQASALLELGSALEHIHNSGSAAGSGAVAGDAPSTWRAHLVQLSAEISNLWGRNKGGTRACDLISSSAVGLLGGLGWSPEASAARAQAAAAAGQLSLAGLQTEMKMFAENAGCLLP